MNKYVIETKQLTKTYGEQTVVNSVNIHVKQGKTAEKGGFPVLVSGTR